MSDYSTCYKCEEFNYLLTPYYKCSKCSYQEKKYGRSNKLEKKQREVIQKIIYSLVPRELVKIRFPGKTNGSRTYGWTTKRKNKFIISIPRKTFYLSQREIVDTAVHETQHVFTWEEQETNPKNTDKDHGPKWYWEYRKNLRKIFQNKTFKEFVDSPNPQAKFRKSYKIYPSIYENKYNQLMIRKSNKIKMCKIRKE